ncbi:MAG: YggS family pyridoxal phosphate-dependent enzyme [Candidatus Nitrotoga sp.]
MGVTQRPDYDSITQNLQAVQHAITQAARTAERDPQEIKLLAVSKTFPATAIREAYEAGQCLFGENYVQEALLKIETLGDLPIQWHFIGPIQSNKTRAIAKNFSWVHSVDNLKIAERLSAQRPDNLPSLNVCIQINTSGELSKSGIGVEQVAELARAIAQLPRINLRGLMTIPAFAASLKMQRIPFSQLREIRDSLNTQSLALDTLSMGMTHDLHAAVLEGATLVRVGTGIFGKRPF